MLTLKNIHAGYSRFKTQNGKFDYQWIIEDISFTINNNESLGIIGQNGAGKSTLANSIIGQTFYRTGDINFNNTDITNYSTQKIINNGIAFFPQGGSVFPNLTVTENIKFASRGIKKETLKQKFEELEGILPVFEKKRLRLQAGYLSGGEKHILTLYMCLLRSPELLILDEPSAGLSPANADIIYTCLQKIKQKNNISFLVIEQNVDKVIKFVDRLIMIKNKKTFPIEGFNNDIKLEYINELYFEN